MAIDENAQVKEQEEVVDEVKEEVEEVQQPEEQQEEEEKPANPPVFAAPFNLEEFEERITKKVQLQCREECKNFLDDYWNQRMSNQSSNATHSNVACAGCSVDPIVGIRYKCTVRKDYNLCERCEDEL